MSQQVETVIVGGGQAGLATSYHLGRLGRENVVLEQAARPAHAWRSDRWDSFVLLTPNWTFRLPGAEYDGPEPDAFMPREEIIARFEQYVERFQLPVRYQSRVIAVEPNDRGYDYRVRTEDELLGAQNVVIATGLFQRPRIPAAADGLPADITQFPSGQYRNPQSLPAGAILVVGSVQSGCQIAEELYQSGRRVYLCVSSAGRAPRRYRGQDVFVWLDRTGFLRRTVDQLDSPKRKFDANPQVSGAAGGHTINLHQFARDGVVLLGYLQAAHNHTIYLRPNLRENLAKADAVETQLTTLIDKYIERTGLDAPPEVLPQLRDGYDAELITELDLRAAGITTVIWATGYQFDFSWVKLPVLDADGFPITQRGVTAYPGLYFVGMPWLHTQASGLLVGVGQDAAFIASAIEKRAKGEA